MLILDRRLTARAGFALLSLFLAQLLTQFFFQDNNLPRIIFGVIYLGLTALLISQHWRSIMPTLREAFRSPARQRPPIKPMATVQKPIRPQKQE